ncbi:MAG: PAS domain-containing sensor histidine kinase, partial [Bacteroidota bacterium]|nr:PAS domain-containing sensor histidine kinase [Bacteroidota bacterium]
LSMVVQKTDNAVMIMDEAGNIEWVNDAFVKMYGYTLDDFHRELGKNMIQLSTHPQIEQIIKNCISEHTTIFYDSMIRSKAGKAIYAQTTITPVLDEKGKVSKLLAIDSNITDIKNAQQKIQLQRDELESLNATKDRFFAIIAHDLKNPFTSLLSLSQSLSENFMDFEPAELDEFLKRVNKSAWQIFNLLENLLTWSRSQTGKLDFMPQKVNIAEALNTTYNLLLATAGKKQIDFSVSCEPGLFMFVDNNMLMTVLRNLTHNAIKFTNQGGKVKLSVEKINDAFIQFIVEDNGIGLSKEDQEKLFRIDIKTKAIGKSKEKGTGLGLILCKEFIQKNGGDLHIESNEGEGSRFIFTVPVWRNE